MSGVKSSSTPSKNLPTQLRAEIAAYTLALTAVATGCSRQEEARKRTEMT